MKIIHITPGAGGMYCGGCLRDNALVGALRKMGHDITMVPLYLPLTLDESDQSSGTPIFFGGISVYLEQKSAAFRLLPRFVHRLLATPSLLRRASGSAAKTRAEDLGELTISMLRGEEGYQAQELDELLKWLRTQPIPDVVVLSNVLLVGLARKITKELGCPVVCTLQGEDFFLDSLPEKHREAAWRTVSERAKDVRLFISPSYYFADLMRRKLSLEPARLSVIYNGINLEGFERSDAVDQANPPVLGYFARMCAEKGLDLLVEAYIQLRKNNPLEGVKLKIGGSCGPADAPFVEKLKARLQNNGFGGDVTFHPNLTRQEKQAFLRSLSVFSVPALYGEAFGLYVIEAMACGVPVVQPRHAAFPELVEQTRGGVLASPDAAGLAREIGSLLKDRNRARALGDQGRIAVTHKFNTAEMAQHFAAAYQQIIGRMPHVR